MDYPNEPPIGNLIAYEYLWLSQSADRDDGEKTYPCAVIFAKRTVLGHALAYVAAISHKPPISTERAVEVPKKLKRHLGLDEEPSWIYTDQANEFVWPGPDLKPAERLSSLPRARGTCVIGCASGGLVRHAQERTHRSLQLGRAQIVRRT
ncbi:MULTISPECIES: hypothetical protein [unclassified Bradyrhizobium]|uniref:hypothetical protein n=1 Tax=unclassified Bradyrhizobium TaxID=2631580 RepID=UPI0023059943|nr:MULTISPECIES: hypothetical protein [unclassified Bradyrhizobium]